MIAIPPQLQNPNYRFVLIKHRDKKPFEVAWQKTNNYAFNDAKLLDHLSKGGNYGILGGFGDLILVDFDSEQVYEQVKDSLPPTFQVKSGGGLPHLYYEAAEGKCEAFKIIDEEKNTLADIQGIGKQLVAPGSVHPNGNVYTVEKDLPIAKINYSELKAILSPWLKEKDKPIVKENKSKDFLVSEIKRRITVTSLLSEFGVNVAKNPTECPFHSSKGGKCLSFDDQKGVWNCFHCDEGGDIFTLHMKKNNLDFKACLNSLAEKLGIVRRKKDEIESPLKDQTDADKNNFLNWTIDKKTGEQKDPKVNVDLVVDYLISKHAIKTIYWAQKGEHIYVYDKGVWASDGRRRVEKEIELLLGEYAKGFIVQEIIGKLKRKTSISYEEFSVTPEDMICLENGVLDVKTEKFLGHSDKFYFKSKLPVPYVPNATCPTFKKFILETLYPQDIFPFQEWWGFTLCPRYFEKKAVIFYGDSDTGKTTVLNIMIALIGEKNISSLSLQRIACGKPFDLLQLKDKFANIHDDLSDKDLTSYGGFKIATGGGWIDAEVKFGDHVNIKTYAKLIFAANKIPPVKDPDDEAYWMRWMPFPFDNAVPKQKQDKQLEAKCKAELSGILNWVLEGLKRLLKKNGFSYSRSVEEVKQIMQYSSHILAAFSQECLEKGNDNDSITKEAMYNLYSKWCEAKGKTRSTKDQLGKQLPKFVSYIVDARTGEKGRLWRGVKLSSLAASYKTVTAVTPFEKAIDKKKQYKTKLDNNIVVYNSSKDVTPDTVEVENQTNKSNPNRGEEKSLLDSIPEEIIPSESRELKFETYLPCSYMDSSGSKCNASPCALAFDDHHYCSRHYPANRASGEAI